jgi:dihydrosphingosine 1-phosphate phosphatase
MVHILASGVFLSGCMKDLLCLPRPLSPPLQRITMSGSAALEYGFPSTHATNAVSVATYAIYVLRTTDNAFDPIMKTILEAVLGWYALSIVAGRLYCGMHGFLDVLVGSALGAGLGISQCFFGPTLDEWLHDASYVRPLIIFTIVLILVRIHPEPADDCPCFDDSVAFAAVIIGVEIGTWHYGSIIPSPLYNSATAPDNEFWWLKYCLRIVLGITIIFSWRGVMKPFLLKILPPLFRIIEDLGLSLPRKYFMSAS